MSGRLIPEHEVDITRDLPNLIKELNDIQEEFNEHKLKLQNSGDSKIATQDLEKTVQKIQSFLDEQIAYYDRLYTYRKSDKFLWRFDCMTGDMKRFKESNNLPDNFLDKSYAEQERLSKLE